MARTKCVKISAYKNRKLVPQLRPRSMSQVRAKKPKTLIDNLEKYIVTVCDEREYDTVYCLGEKDLAILHDLSSLFLDSLSTEHFLQGDSITDNDNEFDTFCLQQGTGNDAGLCLVDIDIEAAFFGDFDF